MFLLKWRRRIHQENRQMIHMLGQQALTTEIHDEAHLVLNMCRPAAVTLAVSAYTSLSTHSS